MVCSIMSSPSLKVKFGSRTVTPENRPEILAPLSIGQRKCALHIVNKTHSRGWFDFAQILYSV